MVAPAIPYGISQAHGAFPGTVSLKPATVLAVVNDAIESLAQQGFRRFLLVNAHHGSKAILQAACAQVHAAIPDSRCLSVQWWELPLLRASAACSACPCLRRDTHAPPKSEIRRRRDADPTPHPPFL